MMASWAAAGVAAEVADGFSFRPPSSLDLLGEGIAYSMALVAFAVGARCLFFAATGREAKIPRSIKLATLGIGMFFPGFLLSLPFTVYFAGRLYGSAAQGADTAPLISLGLGVSTAIVFTLRTRKKSGGVQPPQLM